MRVVYTDAALLDLDEISTSGNAALRPSHSASRSDAALHARYESVHPRAARPPGGPAPAFQRRSRYTVHLDGHIDRIAARRRQIGPPVENRREGERMAERLAVLNFGSRAAGHAGDIQADLERRGLVIGPYDVLIAGHARSQGLVVVTGKLGELRRVDGLRAEDWLTQA